jgi:hypothetical protein
MFDINAGNGLRWISAFDINAGNGLRWISASNMML